MLKILQKWPVMKQLRQKDFAGLGDTAMSDRSRTLEPRTSGTRTNRSVCPYCGVGCAQLIHTRSGRITNIEGDPDSPISRGCLCPKGAATFQLVTGDHRLQKVLYRRPHSLKWEVLPLAQAMDMVADRVKRTRDATWEETDGQGLPLRRTIPGTVEECQILAWFSTWITPRPVKSFLIR